MSQLDQAKREATRLLKLAQKETNGQSPFTLQIKNLSHAKEKIANINGYPNWNTYEKELNIKDDVQGNSQTSKTLRDIKELLSNIEYFNRDIPFVFNKAEKTDEIIIVEQKNHKYIKLGDFSPRDFTSAKDKFVNKNKEWTLTGYPVLIAGSCGSGKTEALLSMAHQYIENHEGVILLNGHGDNSAYFRLFNMAIQHKRMDDLYALNFVRPFQVEVDGKLSHTVDPINPLIGNEDAFKILFGEKIGFLIHELAKCVKSHNGLVSVENIESFLMLNSIEKMKENIIFKDAIKHIESYLNSLREAPLKEHVLNCKDAFVMTRTLNDYKDIFSIKPEIDLGKVFSKRKLLFVNFPSLEKTSGYIRFLVELLMLNINNTAEKYKHIKNIQNVILDDIPYYISNKTIDYIFSNPLPNVNFSYSIQYFTNYNNFNKYIIKSAKTIILMKLEDAEIIDELKLKIINNLSNFPPFYKQPYLKKQYPGEAMVFGYNDIDLNKNNLNSKKAYTFSPLKLTYNLGNEFKEYIYLNKKPM